MTIFETLRNTSESSDIKTFVLITLDFAVTDVKKKEKKSVIAIILILLLMRNNYFNLY